MRLLGRWIQKFTRIAAIALLSWVPLRLALPTNATFITPAAAQTISFEFRTALEPYGSFQRVARWGEVWVPNDVGPDWRPYTVGRWVNSDDYGWYWVSDQPEAAWGWIVFHYGRWVWLDDLGWAWVPGREWGPAWVDWRRGGEYIGWAPLPPEEIVVDIRSEPQYWIFCRPPDFLATNIATVFIEPEPVFFRETVVVNETVLLHDRGFAVDPGIEPAFIAAAIGRPIPEFRVQPHILAGTALVPGAIEVRGDDLRRADFRRDLVQQTNVRATNNVVRPADNVPRPQPLRPNEHGRLGQNPPRAASVAGQAPSQPPGELGRAPQQQGGPRERGMIGTVPEQQQRGSSERSAPGAASGQQRGLNERAAPEQQRGMRERGATGSTTGQERPLYNRGAPGLAPEEQRGLRQQQRGLGDRGPANAAPEQRRGPSERGAQGPRQDRQLFNRGPSGPSPGQDRGAVRERGGMGPTPGEQRQLFNRGPNGSNSGQDRGAVRERGGMGAAPGEQRQLFNRAPSGPAPEQPRSPGARGAPGPQPQAGPGSSGGQRRGFEQGR